MKIFNRVLRVPGVSSVRGGDLDISETATSTRTAKQLFGMGESTNTSNNPWSGDAFSGALPPLQTNASYGRGLPLAMGESGFVTLNKIGAVFGAGQNVGFNFARTMVANTNTSAGVELIRDEVIEQTQTNRLIDFLRNTQLLQSRMSFIATSAVNVATVQTGIGAPQNSSWISNATPRITTTKTVTELAFGLEALTLGNGVVRFTFTDNFDASTAPFDAQYTMGGGSVYGVLPASGVMISWVGSSTFNAVGSNKNTFDQYLPVNTIQNGDGSTPGIAEIIFPGVDNSMHIDDWMIDDSVSNGNTKR